jgi:hypothetical protein
LLLGFLKEMRASAEPYTYFDLPSCSGPFSPESLLECLAVPAVRFPRSDSMRATEKGDNAEIFVDNKLLRFHPEIALVFEHILADKGIISLLRPNTPGDVQENAINIFEGVAKDNSKPDEQTSLCLGVGNQESNQDAPEINNAHIRQPHLPRLRG